MKIRSAGVLSAPLLLAIVLLCGSASGATAALRIENNRAGVGNLTLGQLFGCCNYCTGEVCPAAVCEPCKPVVVENGKQVTLEAFEGPYPLESLFVEVEGGDYYSLSDEADVERLTATALLRVGPGVGCQEGWPSISGSIIDAAVPGPPDSGPFEVCLQFSQNRHSPCILFA